MGRLFKKIHAVFKKQAPKFETKMNKHLADGLESLLDNNIERIEKETGKSSDIVIRRLNLGGQKDARAAVVYTEGLIDSHSLNEILEDLLDDDQHSSIKQVLQHFPNIISDIKENVIVVGSAKEATNFEDLFTHLLSGSAILLIEGISKALAIQIEGWEKRAVEEPQSQTVIKGPKEGFTENLRTNTSLIRRRIKSPDLWIDTKQLGRLTKTNTAIAYIKGIVSDKVVDEVYERLERIDIDSILESGNVEELIQDGKFTPFPTIFNSERPDAVAAGLLEGRVAIVVDGTPFVMMVPCFITDFFQSSEDYYQRADMATFLRLLRYLSFFIALLGPAIYISILTFHQEMAPTQLLISLAAQREGVPFPAYIEALMMEFAFEILREAGVRMPRAVGQAMSIVGALVLGTAAVEAGLVSAAMVIVVAITAIANFVIPSINLAITVRLLRFGMMILAASFGFFGIFIGLILMVVHICGLRSFGVPYTAPMAPFILEDQKDAIFRFPKWALNTRPHLISQQNEIRKTKIPTSKPKDER
ncbi:spore germination protein [Halalkalibacter nanhaiisediminis]|uniref:Spore germination protein KA n=1 Tax=Halalkalibacter nanhaiisediminis TaxID=688079 RepID=A0A562QMN0_9BACI|nr:spore germination protein [Halalkalibacter nanhaiisediminis]TWI57933.1 spore germination protein KA [Halalkalibacter nanhaiisediminis]